MAQQHWPTPTATTRREETPWRVPASLSAQNRTAPVSPPPALSRPYRGAGGPRNTSPQVRPHLSPFRFFSFSLRSGGFLSLCYFSIDFCWWWCYFFLHSLMPCFPCISQEFIRPRENMLQHCHHYSHLSMLNIKKNPSEIWAGKVLLQALENVWFNGPSTALAGIGGSRKLEKSQRREQN